MIARLAVLVVGLAALLLMRDAILANDPAARDVLMLAGVGGLAVLAIVGGAVTASNVMKDRTARSLAILSLLALAAATIHQRYDDIRIAVLRSSPPPVAVVRQMGEAEVARSWDGHYRADVRIGADEVSLLIDTGASLVLLRHEDAERIGLDVSALRYSMPVATANGKSHVAPVVLDEITLGGVTARDVKAAVAKPGKLDMGLLGLSFLGQLRELTFRGDKVILRN